VIRYQKGKTNLDRTEARDSEWQWHQLGHMQVTDFLDKRQFRVTVNGKFSSWHDVLSGIPQGSILGPLLFIIYVNDLPDV